MGCSAEPSKLRALPATLFTDEQERARLSSLTSVLTCRRTASPSRSTWPEAHLDIEAAFGPGVRCERRAVPGGPGRVKRGVDADAPAAGFLTAVYDRLPGDFGEIERRPLVNPALAAGQREQRLDETFLLIAQRQQLLAGRSQRLHGGVRVGE